MSIEREIKIHLSDLGDFRRRLELLNPLLLSPRHFEDNYVLDFPDGRFRSRRCLVRVRCTKEASAITFKGPPHEVKTFKVRSELESLVGDGTVVLQILEQLGMKVWFRYQKYREEYAVNVSGRSEGIHLSLDETPLGHYAELEGSEDGIREAAAALGYFESQFLSASYHSLYEQFCRDKGESPGHMLFV